MRGPFSVGIIMDGNRRWAKAAGRPQLEGHEAGKDVLLRMFDDYRDIREKWGTAHYIFYTFSTENWNRSIEEVGHLMGIFERAFNKVAERLPRLLEDGVQVRFIGERSRFSQKLQDLMNELEQKTTAGTKGTMAFAVSYGGRSDILQAVNRLIVEDRDGVSAEDISAKLWTNGIPDPDLIIRTGGEERLSNFLSWESVYSELSFIDTLWPDFSREKLEELFTNFASRERRRGK